MVAAEATFPISHSRFRLMVVEEFNLSYNLSHLMVAAEEATFRQDRSLVRSLVRSRVHILIRVRPRNSSVKWKTILRSIRSSIKSSPRFRRTHAA